MERSESLAGRGITVYYRADIQCVALLQVKMEGSLKQQFVGMPVSDDFLLMLTKNDNIHAKRMYKYYSIFFFFLFFFIEECFYFGSTVSLCLVLAEIEQCVSR